jgi:hypothetical protein
MHQTITGILRKSREIEASAMGVETIRGYNLHRPPGYNPKTRDHKQASIFVDSVRFTLGMRMRRLFEKGLSRQKMPTSTEVYAVQPKVYGH